MASLEKSPNDNAVIRLTHDRSDFSFMKAIKGSDEEHKLPASLYLDNNLANKLVNNQHSIYSIELIELSGIELPADVILDIRYYDGRNDEKQEGDTIYLWKYRSQFLFQKNVFFLALPANTIVINGALGMFKISAFFQSLIKPKEYEISMYINIVSEKQR